MGVVISPPRYRPEIERAIRATTWNTPTLISSLICARIEDGTVARFETQKRRDARQRQQVAREVLCGLPSSVIPIRTSSGCRWVKRAGPIGWRMR